MFAPLVERFHGAVEEPAVVGWDIATPGGVLSYRMTLSEDGCQVEPVAAVGQHPRVTLGIDLADFVELAAGTMAWMPSFLAGRLRISGDLAFAMALEGWFE